MIAGIFLSLVAIALPIVAGILYARAVAATAPPPMTWREPQPAPLMGLPTEPEPPAPDEWDALMTDIQRAVDSGRLRL